MSDWSCTAPANVEQIQAHLKAEYLKALDRRLRDSREYEADEKIINDRLITVFALKLKGFQRLQKSLKLRSNWTAKVSWW